MPMRVTRTCRSPERLALLRLRSSAPPELRWSASLLGGRFFCVRQTIPHLVHRASLPAIFELDVDGKRPPLALEELQDFPDRRVARPPRHVVALVLLAILEVQVRDVGVVRRDVLDGVEVRRSEVADVEVDLEVL